MAKDREISAIEERENDFYINEYTIRYDSNAKRFFKGFAPKVVSGGAISTALFATLGVATVATGGFLGLGLGAIAGISAGVGTLTQTVYSGIVYGKNMSKKRFKDLGIGGLEDAAGTIEVIREAEKQALECTQLLESQPNTKEFTLNDGTYPRRVLKLVAKEKADIAYHGLKYLMEQGLILSDKINSFLIKQEKHGLTENEAIALDKYWAVMDRISECTKDLASNRESFNPYKQLIINSLRKGCLLGRNDEQNSQIRKVSKMKDEEMAVKLYSNMYEMPVREKLMADREETIVKKQEINNQYKQNEETIEQLIKYDGDITKLDEKNRSMAHKVNEINSCYTLINVAKKFMGYMPEQMKAERTALTNTITIFKQAIEAKDKDAIRENKAALDTLVNDAQRKINVAYYKGGKVSARKELGNIIADYQTLTEQLDEDLAREKVLHAKATQRGWNATQRGRQARKDNAQLTTANAMAKAFIEQQEGEIADLEGKYKHEQGKHKKATRIIQGMVNRVQTAESQIEQANTARDNAIAEREQFERANTELVQEASNMYNDKKLAENRAIKAEGLAYQAMQVLNDTEAQLSADLERVVSELYDVTGEKADAEKRAVNAQNRASVAKRQATQAKNKNKEQAKTIEQQASTIGELTKTIGSLNDDINNYIVAQGENIDRIASLETEKAGLTADNKKLKRANTTASNKNKELASQNQDLTAQVTQLKAENDELAEAGAEVAYDLRKAEADLARVRSERDMYKTGVDELQGKISKLSDSLETIDEKLAIAQGADDYAKHNFAQARKINPLRNIIKKVDAHIEFTREAIESGSYTEEEIAKFEGTIDDLLYFVRGIRSKNLKNATTEDIDLWTNTVKAVYSNGARLPKATAKELKEVAESQHSLKVR